MKTKFFFFSIIAVLPFITNAQNCPQEKTYEKALRDTIGSSYCNFQVGQKFFITYDAVVKDKNIRLLGYDTKPIYDSHSNLQNGINAGNFKDKAFILSNIEINENEKVVLVFECEGKKYKFISSKSKQEDICMNDLYDASTGTIMDKLNELTGKELYVKANYWGAVDDNGKVAKTETGVALKYYPVTITRAEQRNEMQFIVFFKPKEMNNEYVLVFNTMFEEDGFSKKFTFCNPRDSYKNISDKTWKSIQEMQVTEGMSPEEVKLILGKPEAERQVVEDKQNCTLWVYLDYSAQKRTLVYFQKNKVKNILIDTYYNN